MYQELQLFNSLGKLVVQAKGTDLHSKLDLSYLPIGRYLLQIRLKDRIVVTQMVRK